MREDAQRRIDYFLQPRPEPNRLNPSQAADTRRSLTTLRRLLLSAPPKAVRAVLLVEAASRPASKASPATSSRAATTVPAACTTRWTPPRHGNADITEWHRILWQELPPHHVLTPSRWRKCRVRVGDYFPPPPQNVPGHMAAFRHWSSFETIHPLADGNGRTGRNRILQTLDLPMTINRSIYRRRDYYNSLANASWPQWQAYMLDLIAEAAREQPTTCAATNRRNRKPDG